MSTKMEAYHKVCILAGAVVLEAPRGDKPTAYVPRSALNKLEAALIEAGFDMKGARAKLDADKRAERKAISSKRDADTLAKFPIGTCVELYRRRFTSIPAAPYDVGFVIKPDSTSRPRRGKPDEVYVRWNIPGGATRCWVSVYDLEAKK